MQKISNTLLSISILALGGAGLTAMVWLSPTPEPQAAPAVSATTNAPESSGAVPAEVASGVDPFAAHMREAQASTVSAKAASDAKPTAIPVGVDPFKAKLNEQSRQATASPFGAGPAKP